jgi:uncharacterized protein YabE (DUF348 family)
MNKLPFIFLASALALTGILIVIQGFNKTITLKLNGNSEQVETKAWKVSSLLAEQELLLREEDLVNPSANAWITGGETITLEQATWVTITADGKTTQLFTRQRNLKSILAEAGINLSRGDQILLDGLPVAGAELVDPVRNHSFQVLREHSIELNGNGGDELIHSNSSIVGDALWEKGIDISIGDRISIPLDAPLDNPITVELKTAQDVTIRFKSGSIKIQTAAETVGEALAEAGFPLQGLDFSLPEANSPIPEDGKIQVIRVRENMVLESEPIPYESQTQPVADLEIDERIIVQPGVYGLNTKRIRVRYEDGVEISRLVEDEYLSQEPQPEIIGYGTQVTPKTIDTPDGPKKYWRALNMYAISYNVTSNGGYGTATGIPLDKGIAAIDPSYIPYGTRMYVPGYGEALAADTGGGINGRMIDLGYLDENYVSWHEWVTVYFLWPPPENIVWVIP